MLHESALRSAAEKARLAARLQVHTDASGRRVSGELDPVFYRLHRRLVDLEDQLLDHGRQPSELRIKWFNRAASYLELVHQQVLREARRQLAAA